MQASDLERRSGPLCKNWGIGKHNDEKTIHEYRRPVFRMKIKYLHKLVTFLVLMAVTTYTIVVKTIRRVRPHLYWESLARQNPALYLSLYFIAVIGFGLGFMCLPEGDFYSPYEKLEPISVFKNIHLSKLLFRRG